MSLKRFWFPAGLCLFLVAITVGLARPVEVIPSEFHGAQQPQVAVSVKGDIYVVFGKETSIYVTCSTDGGAHFSPPGKVATVTKLALGMRRGPRIAVAGAAVVVTAVAQGNLLAWTSRDGGNSWSAAAKVNDAADSAREGLHSLAGSGNLLYATWLDLRVKGTQIWGASSTDGGATWSANRRIYQSPAGHVCECCHPTAAISPQGVVWVMWRNWLDGARDMYLAASRDGGKTFGAATKSGAGTWPLNACPMDGGTLAFMPDGQPVAVWRRGLSIFKVASEAAEQLLDERGTQPIIATGKDGVYAVWQKGTRLLLQIGNGPPRVLAQNAAFAAIASASPQHAPVVVWESAGHDAKTILAQVLK